MLKLIDNFLSEDECQELIDYFENEAVVEVVERAGYAKYIRTVKKDAEFAKKLFDRIELPSHYMGQKIVGLNDHFRFSKYHPGWEFKMHKDGFNQDSNGNRSIMTLNIFLNEDFEGGSTDFFKDDGETLRLKAIPKTGRAALFYSQQYHCGAKVLSGYKYLIRTDVMVGI